MAQRLNSCWCKLPVQRHFGVAAAQGLTANDFWNANVGVNALRTTCGAQPKVTEHPDAAKHTWAAAETLKTTV